MSYRKGYYKKDGTYVQGHYVNSRKTFKNFNNKKKNGGCAGVLLLLIILIISISCSDDDSDCGSKTCSDFLSQSEAQLIFDMNRNCYRNLDIDNDNIPCENLPN